MASAFPSQVNGPAAAAAPQPARSSTLSAAVTRAAALRLLSSRPASASPAPYARSSLTLPGGAPSPPPTGAITPPVWPSTSCASRHTLRTATAGHRGLSPSLSPVGPTVSRPASLRTNPRGLPSGAAGSAPANNSSRRARGLSLDTAMCSGVASPSLWEHPVHGGASMRAFASAPARSRARAQLPDSSWAAAACKGVRWTCADTRIVCADG